MHEEGIGMCVIDACYSRGNPGIFKTSFKSRVGLLVFCSMPAMLWCNKIKNVQFINSNATTPDIFR